LFIIHNGGTVNTRAIALTIVFTALAISLTTFGIPAVFLANFYFRFWEIPIVMAFLLLGPKIGVTVAVLRTLAELTLFPSPVGSFLGPLIALGGTLSMMLGIYSANWLLKRKASQDRHSGTKSVTYFTALGTLFRAAIVPFIMYPVWRFFLPLTLSDAQIMALIPPLMLFVLTLCLYTIPVGYLLARTVSRNLNVGNQL
jgi:riboflavin transporter FmnP